MHGMFEMVASYAAQPLSAQSRWELFPQFFTQKGAKLSGVFHFQSVPELSSPATTVGHLKAARVVVSGHDLCKQGRRILFVRGRQSRTDAPVNVVERKRFHRIDLRTQPLPAYVPLLRFVGRERKHDTSALVYSLPKSHAFAHGHFDFVLSGRPAHVRHSRIDANGALHAFLEFHHHRVESSLHHVVNT